jgi:hypothetical protein
MFYSTGSFEESSKMIKFLYSPLLGPRRGLTKELLMKLIINYSKTLPSFTDFGRCTLGGGRGEVMLERRKKIGPRCRSARPIFLSPLKVNKKT